VCALIQKASKQKTDDVGQRHRRLRLAKSWCMPAAVNSTGWWSASRRARQNTVLYGLGIGKNAELLVKLGKHKTGKRLPLY